MKKYLLIVLSLMFSLCALAVTPNKIVIPDIEGYKTLKGDFHIHTVFSDAMVWPATCVQEAKWEGLDVIAISDHIDTRHQKLKNQGYFSGKTDRDTSYELAQKAAGKKFIVIHGGEISRGMPPGHFNCLFIKDNNEICAAAEKNDHDHILAMEGGLKEARRQGGFLMWNHPNWCKQAPDHTIMHPIHEKLIAEGYVDGIEVYNMVCGYSPEVHEWCLKYNLAMLGNSDSHYPMITEIDYLHGKHRPITLVFAKKRSAESIREALDARRSAVFAEGMVYGREQELAPLFKACVKVKNILWEEKMVSFTLENISSIPVRLVKAPGSESVWYARYIDLPPHSSIVVKVRPNLVNNVQPKFADDIKEVVANFYIETFQIGANKPLHFSVTATR